jgi:hypothetical protein
MKIISTIARMGSDILMGLILITAPWLFGTVGDEMQSWMAAGLGGYTIVYNLMATFETMAFIAIQKLRVSVVRQVQHKDH